MSRYRCNDSELSFGVCVCVGRGRTVLEFAIDLMASKAYPRLSLGEAKLFQMNSASFVKPFRIDLPDAQCNDE